MSSMNKFLVVGATGGSGKMLVESLLAKNKKVAILVRNKTSAKTAFKESYEKIDHVVEMDLGTSQINCKIKTEYNEDLTNAINWCDVIISALGVRYSGDPQKCDYFSIVELLDHCNHSKDSFHNKLLVYISTLYITRPYSFVSFFLNSLLHSVMGWKALAENRIRDSGLNYLIVRPGRLTDSQDIKTVQVHQGDSTKGEISRKNLANMILHSIENNDINKGRVTVEVIEEKNHTSQNIKINSLIKQDDESSFITGDHFAATRNISILLWGFLTILILYVILKFK
jgi:putative NADH-flavin reductase